MLNRSQPPETRTIDQFSIKEAETFRLKNGIPLHCIHAGEHDIIQFEIILRSGKWYEPVNGISYFTSKMLNEGTSQRGSSEISEFFESFGVQFNINPGNDLVTLSVYTLNKHFGVIIPVLAECLFEPSFPLGELNILKDLQIQHIKVNNEKGSYIASGEFRKAIFGEQHPYGMQIEIGDINDNIGSPLLRKYHSEWLLNGMELFLTGKIDDSLRSILENNFGNLAMSEPRVFHTANYKFPGKERKNIHKELSLQSSIRYGKRIIMKSNPDQIGLLILNELLGGFFGSRLMKNIREEKGYTYGIHSSIQNLINDSYFVIGTDVVREHTNQAIEEINKEITRLQTEMIPVNELEVVRNYMLGSFLSSLETSFSLADKFKSIYFHGLGYDYYERYIGVIKNISPREIQELAIKYLDMDDLTLVIVGDG